MAHSFMADSSCLTLQDLIFVALECLVSNVCGTSLSHSSCHSRSLSTFLPKFFSQGFTIFLRPFLLQYLLIPSSYFLLLREFFSRF